MHASMMSKSKCLHEQAREVTAKGKEAARDGLWIATLNARTLNPQVGAGAASSTKRGLPKVVDILNEMKNDIACIQETRLSVSNVGALTQMAKKAGWTLLPGEFSTSKAGNAHTGWPFWPDGPSRSLSLLPLKLTACPQATGSTSGTWLLRFTDRTTTL